MANHDPKTGEILDDPVSTHTVEAPIPFLRADQAQDSALDEHGHEVLDGTPMAPPVGYQRQPSMAEIIREQVRNALFQRDLAEAGYETFEEANDFDVEDGEPSSVYEREIEISDAEILAAYPHLQAEMSPQGSPAPAPASSQPQVAPAAPAVPSPSSTSS